MKKIEIAKRTKERRIYITQTDAARLKEMISVSREVNGENEPLLCKLEEKLGSVRLYHAENISERVVTMNTVSRVMFLNTEGESIFWLGYPDAINYDGKKLSILTSIGIALLGSRAGDWVEWETPAGRGQLMVKDILYQPETCGDYHL